LLNRIVGFRHAIVDTTPGVTRDRNYAQAVWNGRQFNLVDTGGLDPDDSQELMQQIKNQVSFALREAEAIIFVCDGKAGLVPDDKQILNYLRRQWADQPLFIAVNKIDNPNNDSMIAEFYELGAKELFQVSSVHGHGVADLLDAVVADFDRNWDGEEIDKRTNLEKIALVGKPNVGKSSIFNSLIGEDRSIVDSVPGTTRDTILKKFVYKGKSYSFIDTAGLRRPDRNKDNVEQFSVYRTLGAIKDTDLAILVMDASEGKISNQDKRIAGRVIDSGAGCIIVWNKWDLGRHDDRHWDKLIKHTRHEFPQLAFAPILATSAKTGLRVNKLFELIDRVQETGRRTIPSDRLKQILYDAVTIQPPATFKGRALKLYSLLQFAGPPVVFKLKASDPEGVHFSYQRYILNHIRQEETFEGWPIKLVVRK
jgi:GTP-binding protein